MPYVELHCHSYYSFQEGASSIEELVETAKSLDYPALALTDHDNVCGALSFAEISKTANIQPITGVEITLTDNYHLTLVLTKHNGMTPNFAYKFATEFCLLGFYQKPMQKFLKCGKLNWINTNAPRKHSTKPG